MLHPQMTEQDQYDDRDTLIQYLGHQLSRGRLLLLLGAGTTKPLGLPEWKQLIHRLYEDSKEPLPADATLERGAEYLRDLRFRDKDGAFVQALHRVLYRDFDGSLPNLATKPLLAAVGALSMASRRGSLSEIITLNYDNILELYLGYHGVVCAPVYREAHWAGAQDVTVYHPHGYIPFTLPAAHQTPLVLGQDSYSRVVGRVDSPWHQVLVCAMRRKTCLFIGLSGADMNLDSLVLECSQRHASTEESSAYWGVALGARDDALTQSLWRRRRVHYCGLGDLDREIPDMLFGICQAAAAIWSSSSP